MLDGFVVYGLCATLQPALCWCHSSCICKPVMSKIKPSTSYQSNAIAVTGLLNAVDGVAAQEGRLLFMTTNHIDRLSEALIRPGRVDVRLEFTHARQGQIHDFFLNFYQV